MHHGGHYISFQENRPLSRTDDIPVPGFPKLFRRSDLIDAEHPKAAKLVFWGMDEPSRQLPELSALKASNWPPVDWQSDVATVDDSDEAAIEWLEHTLQHLEQLLRLYHVLGMPVVGQEDSGGQAVYDAYRLFRLRERQMLDRPHGPFNISDALFELRKVRTAYMETEVVENVPGNRRSGKRSTAKGEAKIKLVAALTAHHHYQNGSCLNFEPIGVRKLAEMADVGISTASDFFKKNFVSHKIYEQQIRSNNTTLIKALAWLNEDLLPNILFKRIHNEHPDSSD